MAAGSGALDPRGAAPTKASARRGPRGCCCPWGPATGEGACPASASGRAERVAGSGAVAASAEACQAAACAVERSGACAGPLRGACPGGSPATVPDAPPWPSGIGVNAVRAARSPASAPVCRAGGTAKAPSCATRPAVCGGMRPTPCAASESAGLSCCGASRSAALVLAAGTWKPDPCPLVSSMPGAAVASAPAAAGEDARPCVS